MRNLLVLRGDDPAAGDQPDAKPVFDLDTAALTRDRASASATRGELPSGRKVSGKAELFIGAADMPIDPPEGMAAEEPARPRSRPARNSRRRSSAWMSASSAATWRGSPRTG